MPESTNPASSSGIFIHDISIRNGTQVVPLETLDTDEVLAQSELRLSGNLGGKFTDGIKVRLFQCYRLFLGKSEEAVAVEMQQRRRFKANIKLHNGANGLRIVAVGSDGTVLDEKAFQLHYKSSFREWNETIFIAFFLAILIRGLVLQAFWIPTGSMEPTLLGEKRNPFTKELERGGDRILVSRFAYVLDLSLDGRIPWAPKIWLRQPDRGDIIVFKYPDPDPTSPPKDYIKRVVGLPGDEIVIEAGHVMVNGTTLVEPYISEPPVHDYFTRVPEDHLFVMGDNRNNSSDSRFWGPMPLANLKGQAVFSYLPTNRIAPIRSHSHSLKISSDLEE